MVNGRQHGLGFFTARGFELADALRELLASLREDEQEKVEYGGGGAGGPEQSADGIPPLPRAGDREGGAGEVCCHAGGVRAVKDRIEKKRAAKIVAFPGQAAA